MFVLLCQSYNSTAIVAILIKLLLLYTMVSTVYILVYTYAVKPENLHTVDFFFLISAYPTLEHCRTVVTIYNVNVLAVYIMNVVTICNTECGV